MYNRFHVKDRFQLLFRLYSFDRSLDQLLVFSIRNLKSTAAALKIFIIYLSRKRESGILLGENALLLLRRHCNRMPLIYNLD